MQAIGELPRHDGNPMEGFVDLLIDALARHPALPRLVTREVLLSGGEMQQRFAQQYAPRLGGALPALLAAEQEKGRIDKRLEPGILTMMIISLCMFPFIARPLAERVLDVNYDPAGLATLREHVLAMLRSGVEK